MLAAEHGAAVPDDPALFQQLPGVGRYTVGAVLSQSFDRPLPILEANSLRVLSRVLAYGDDPRSPAGQRMLWQAAEELVPVRDAGAFNQSLMELGALICTTKMPACANCPIAGRCAAFRDNLQERIPVKAPRAETVSVSEVAVVVKRGQRVLLAQRPDDGRWANMWEFPRGALKDRETHTAAASRVVDELTALDVDVGAELLSLTHGVTRFRITLACLSAEYRGGRFRSKFYQRGQWVEPARLGEFPLSTPQRKLAKRVAAG